MGKHTQFEVLLDVRESQRDAFQAELADALSELDRRRRFVQRKKAMLQGTRGELESIASEREALMDSSSFQPRQLAALDRHADVLAESVQQQQEALERAKQSVRGQKEECDRVRAELNGAQKALEAVRKHYQRQRDEEALVAKRKRQAQSDEVASRRWWEENS